jgi:WD40 repeat protein
VIDTGSGAVVFHRSGLPGGARCVAWSPDDRTLLVVCSRGDALLLDASTGEEIGVLGPHPAPVWHASFDGEGSLAVTACEDGILRLFDVRDRVLLRAFAGHTQGVRCARFERAGKHVVTTAEHVDDRSIRVWNVEDGSCAVIPPLPEEPGRRPKRPILASLSPDGRRVVAGYWDNRARVWDIAEKRVLFELPGEDIVDEVLYSPDGRLIATSNRDSIVRLWDARNGAEIAALRGNRTSVNTVAWSASGDRILSAASDGVTRWWPVDPLAAARERRPRELTPAERESYDIAAGASR